MERIRGQEGERKRRGMERIREQEGERKRRGRREEWKKIWLEEEERNGED
jgi:hypothetical protein